MPQASIVVPTYCEADNLPVLVPRIHSAAVAAGLVVEIVVVDDNSPDATAEVCRELSQQFPLRLLVREGQRGLAGAVIAGMKASVGDVLVIMDADLSHPPEIVPALVGALANPQVDFAIGSRYVAGGTTTEDWGVLRWLNSKVATLLARPLTSAKDPMAGFFAIRRARFEEIADVLDPIGYKIGLELIVKSKSRNVVEIPIAFQDRLHGQSKLNLREQFNYLRHLRRLYNERYGMGARFFQFAAVGLSGMVVDLATFGLLLHWILMPVARALAIWVAMTWNFVLNRNVTFSHARGDLWLYQYVSYCASCLAGAGLNWGISVGLCRYMPFFATRQLPAALIGVMAGTVSNFLLCHQLVFRAHPKPADPAPAQSDVATTVECVTVPREE